KNIKERISNRNLNDKRLNEDYIYTEKHHIIPRHAGGNDNVLNLAEMLPEEHYMAHLLRYKAYNDRNDFLAIRFMVNGYINKKILADKILKVLKIYQKQERVLW
ncbi:MAG: HNH endonuclease, partial [Chitinophagia bacterium]|nr:HNH endonuclease [Chitinophagia bacterium]